MTGFVIERQGYVHAGALMADAIIDLLANGFTQVFPATPFVKPSGSALDAYTVTLEASGAVDPLNDDAVQNKQPWRIQFDIKDAGTVGVYMGTPLQLPADGSHAKLTDGTGKVIDVLGSVGDVMANGGIDSNNSAQGFINRSKRVGANAGTYPMTYRITVSPRGLFLATWEDANTTQTGQVFNWLLVQRPVDRTTGAVVVTGKAPLFCLNAVNGNYWKFVVRESDVLRPSLRVVADADSADSDAVINSKEQVSLSEDNKYIVTFPCRLNSGRYRYSHELDMIGVTSADVVSQFSDVPLTVYGEQTPRVYKALQANGVNNTQMRVLSLSQGGGL